MSGKLARLLFTGICGLIAALIILGVLSFLIGALIFAGALVLLGGISKGFRK